MNSTNFYNNQFYNGQRPFAQRPFAQRPFAKRPVSPPFLWIGLGVIVVVVFVYFYYVRKNPEKKSSCELGPLGAYTVCQPADFCPMDKNEKAVQSILKDGPDCPSLEDRTKYRYNTEHDCELSGWTEWRVCDDGECTPGKNRIRTRTVLVPANDHGKCEGPLTDEKYTEPTAIDCILESFGSWKPCNPVDGCPADKNEYRTRGIIQHPNGGLPCGALTEYRKVEPLNCTTEWSNWRPCNPGDHCVDAEDTDVTSYREKVVRKENNAYGTCADRGAKEYAIIPSWAEGKICGETTEKYCFMPFGKPCDSGKNIESSKFHKSCKLATSTLVGGPITKHEFTNMYQLPQHCSYKQEDDRYITSYGSTNQPFGNYMNKSIGHHAVCHT